MNRILVWDIPARLFHWSFAVSLAAAIAVGFLVDHEQSLFPLHMLFGIIALFLLIVRLVLGVVGSRYSRFASFPVTPPDVGRYMISALTSKTKLYPGNNPGSAVAALLMFMLVPALCFTGIGFAGEAGEELHESFAWGLLTVIVVHLAGLTWHTIRHRENIAMAMISGKKPGKPEDAITSSNAAWGLLVFFLSAFWVAALFVNYNARAGTVKIPGIGVTLNLGENERGDKQEGHGDADD